MREPMHRNQTCFGKVRGINMLVVAILLFTASVSYSIDCPNVKNPSFNAAARDAVVNKHNELRSKLAYGTAVFKGGEHLRSGKNIYKISWDCDLEKIAQQWAEKCAEKCELDHSPYDYRNAGENIYQSYFGGDADSAEKVGVDATNLWWAELEQYNATTNPSNTFGYDVHGVAGHWTQQAWGSTRYIGCGMSKCRKDYWNSAILVCNYRATGNMLGSAIFEWGDGCSQASDCTTYQNSQCEASSKLCISNA